MKKLDIQHLLRHTNNTKDIEFEGAPSFETKAVPSKFSLVFI